jgi:hypothetical protein
MNLRSKCTVLLVACVIINIKSKKPHYSDLAKALYTKYTHGCSLQRFCGKDERLIAFAHRLARAQRNTLWQHKSRITDNHTNDEKEIPLYAAQFTKTLEHDPVTGLLTKEGQEQYKKLLKALKTGNQKKFNEIIRASAQAGKFINPQGAFMFSLEGIDSAFCSMKPFPPLQSAEAAAYLLEVYLMAFCRDVNFNDYGTGQCTDADGLDGSITQTAAQVLQDLGAAYQGPRNKDDHVDTSVLFRGDTHGDLTGPYLSQFLLLSLRDLYPAITGIPALNQIPFEITQQYAITQRREFGVTFQDFVSMQNGLVPKKYTQHDFDTTNKRYIINGRDLANYVHFDGPYQAYYNAVNILLSRGFPLSPHLPYSTNSIKNEAPFVSMGAPDIYALIAGAALEGFKAAWAQKWRAQRALRPEAFAGLVHNAKVSGNNQFKLHKSLFALHDGIDVLELIKQHNIQQASPLIDPEQRITPQDAATYLLAQVYPEGSPAHPSCPSGHATAAGACVTVIKALFDDRASIISKVTPVKVDPTDATQLIPLHNEGENDFTVASELNKLASNIAAGRNFSGVHYRCDALGIQLGEQVAIRYLQDHACTYAEPTFKGFELTTFDNKRIRVTSSSVTEL